MGMELSVPDYPTLRQEARPSLIDSLYSSSDAGTTMDQRLTLLDNQGRMPRNLYIEKLSDEFGQSLILLKCSCGHGRRCNPSTLA
jgi:hypothetical protein